MALLGAPLFAIVLAAAMLGFLASDIDLAVVAIELYRISDTPLLVALPFFTFAGYVMASANTSERLMGLVRSLFGWMPAGLAIVGFVACALFTALTGASGVTIVALGALLLPMLKAGEYDERFSLGLVTTSGSLGLLIVPSAPLLLYGIVAQQLGVGEPFTIGQLFLGGLVPAALMVLLLSAWAWWRHGDAPRTRFDLKDVRAALVAARWELPLPFVVLGGIYSGYFAISEAAAMTALYVLVVEVGAVSGSEAEGTPGRDAGVDGDGGQHHPHPRRGAGVHQLPGGRRGATAPVRVHAGARLKRACLPDPPQHPLLLALGALLDVFAAIVIMVPLLLPVAAGYGIHPIHLGIIFLANLQIGYFTPPVGMNLFIASYRFDRPVLELYAACWPFMLVLLIALLAITYIPALSLWFLP